jgi:hypothetical protein
LLAKKALGGGLEIREEHVEWATVHRMREMLASVRRDYEVTQTYSLFTGILCWTIQRIRTPEDQQDRIARAMERLRQDLERKTFIDFAQLRPMPVEVGRPSRSETQAPRPLNSFIDFAECDGPFHALRTLEALRNAVAHGDARCVKPWNQNGRLIAYEFHCNETKRINKKRETTWDGCVTLDRFGMNTIAAALADKFCRAIADDYPALDLDAAQLREGHV